MKFSNRHKIIITNHDQVKFITGTQVWINILKLINAIHHIKKLKKKIHMITLTEVEKAFDKFQNPLWGRDHTSQEKKGVKGNYLNLITIYNKLTVNICLTAVFLHDNGFPPKTGRWRDKTILCQHTEHSAGNSCQCNKTKKGNKR